MAVATIYKSGPRKQHHERSWEPRQQNQQHSRQNDSRETMVRNQLIDVRNGEPKARSHANKIEQQTNLNINQTIDWEKILVH